MGVAMESGPHSAGQLIKNSDEKGSYELREIDPIEPLHTVLITLKFLF